MNQNTWLYVMIVTCAHTALAQTQNGADVVFILDGSGSVGNSSFRNYFLQFVEDVASRLVLGPQASRVAVVQFGNKGITEVNFTYSIATLETQSEKMRYLDENTNTAAGLLEAMALFSRGARGGNWPKIGVLLTDGACSWDCHALSGAAEGARNISINMLAIGIGEKADKVQLNMIASDERTDVFEVEKSSELLAGSFVKSVLDRIGGIINDSFVQTTTDRTTVDGADIVFILDSSESVTETSFQGIILPFVRDVIERLPLGTAMYQAAIISYGTGADLYTRLLNENDLDSITSFVDVVPFRNERTNTAEALRTFRTAVTSDSWRSGSREQLPTIGVLITDGRSTVDPHLTVPEAIGIHNAGLSMIVLAVGQDGDMELDALRLAASEPKAEHFLRYMNFSDMATESAVDSLVARVKSIAMLPPTTQDPGVFTDWECDFEDMNDPFCGMDQSMNDDFDWTRKRGATPSFDTGPHRAYSGDYYIFIEASLRDDKDTARINIPRLYSSGEHCLSFAYNMHGYHIRELRVIVTSDLDDEENWIWQLAGKQGTAWKNATQPVALRYYDQISFEAERGEAFSGDIALDKIHIRRGDC